MKRKALIISISGHRLTREEKLLLAKEKPWGLILFERNIKSFKQTQNLIVSIRKTVKDNKFPILIDEEGGTVSRLKRIFDNKIYSQKYFGDLFKKNSELALFFYKYYLSSVLSVLKNLGININTVPVLDVLNDRTHKIIGSRSYGKDINIIKKLSNICCKIYADNKIGNVIKHIPGHGHAKSDSHTSLPVVNKNYKSLYKNEFKSFKNCNSRFAMTAHILYKNIDNKNSATQSKLIIKDIIRGKLRFRGIIISDDISMRALKDDLITNALKSLKAGCNIVLYCKGKATETKMLLKHVPFIDNFTSKKTSEFYKFLR